MISLRNTESSTADMNCAHSIDEELSDLPHKKWDGRAGTRFQRDRVELGILPGQDVHEGE